jgi:hypothetical protein
MKICCTCHQEKQLFEFNKKSSNSDGLERYCKECHRAKNKKHYQENANAYKLAARRWKKEKQEWWSTYKSALLCSVCGESRYWCLDFHHTDPLTKENNVSNMIAQNKSRESIINETLKCRVLCRNCHADVHYKQTISQ